jgi:hypothetical protein
LRERYEVAHAVIMAGPYGWLQAMVDDGSAWLEDGRIGDAALAGLTAGALIAAPEPMPDAYGSTVPAWHQLVDEVDSMGAVANAEAWIDEEVARS